MDKKTPVGRRAYGAKGTAAFGPAGGSRAHGAMATAARGLDGIGGVVVQVEESFVKGAVGKGADYGQQGSIRADCILLFGGIRLVLDWKFGRAMLTPKRKKLLEDTIGAPTVAIPAGIKFHGPSRPLGWGNAGH